MMIEALKTVYAFNREATERVLKTAEQATKEEWLAPQTAGRGSIRDTLVHLVGGMKVWMATWGAQLPQGEAERGTPNPEDFPTVADVQAYFKLMDGALQKYLDGLKQEDLNQVFTRTMPTGAVWKLPLWQAMLHVTYHGMQHRSEVAAMLTAFNHSPGELGFSQFLMGSMG